MRKIFALLLLFGLSNISYTQVTVSGLVLDSATHEPLSLSLVKMAELHTVANDLGEFRFTNIPVGKHVILISHIGCDLKQMPIKVKTDTSITVYLPHHLHSLEEVIAFSKVGTKEPQARLVRTLSSKKLESLAAVSLGDALQNTNGVHFLKTGSTISKPIINGMHSNRISVINDNSKHEGQQWGSEHAPEIDPLSAGNIEIIKGASTLQFGGDAMGGVIRILPAKFRDSSYSQLSFLTRAETNSRAGQVGIKLEKFNQPKLLGQRMVINAKRTGDASAANYVLSNTGFGQLSGSYFVSLKRAKNNLSFSSSAFLQRIGILASSHIGNLSDLYLALQSDSPLIIKPFTYKIQAPSQYIQHYSSKLKWDLDSSKLGKITSTYTIQFNRRQEFDNHKSDALAALDLNLLTQQLNLQVDQQLSNYRLQYGAMGEWQQNIFYGRYFIPNYTRYKIGSFVITTLEKENYLIEGGLRYDVQNIKTYRYVKSDLSIDDFNFNGLSANLSGWRKLNEDLKLFGSISTRFRSPDINELYSNGLHHGSAALEFGDLNLNSERSYSANVALNYNHNRIRILAEPYFHYFKNYIYLQPSGETQLSIRGAFPVFNYIQTDATYSGIDLDLMYLISSGWTAQVNAAFLWVLDVENNQFIYGIPPQRYQAKLKHAFAEFSFIENGYWFIGANYTSRQTRIESDEDFTDSPDSYLLLNAEFGSQYKKTPLHLSIGVKNLLNTSYRDYMNRYRYYADDIGINFYITLNYSI
jgi:iron complex outermembrane receptor protein